MILSLDGTPISAGASGYCRAGDLPREGVARQWSYRGKRRSILWRGGGVVKVADAFEEHGSVEELAALLHEAESRGVSMPSSYADLFHRRWRAPPMRRAHAKLFAGAVRGGWIGLLTDDPVHHEPLWQYDIRSAYLAAVRDGLPDPGSFRVVRHYCGPGVYWVHSPQIVRYPYPWHREGIFAASWEEIEYLCLRSRVVGHGLAFEPNTFDAAGVVRDIRQWSAWKAIGRSFWGRWAALEGPVMETLTRAGDVNTRREMPPLWACPSWAAVITSRVRLRLAEVYDRGGVLMVQTDAVVTRAPLVTGADIGDWREVAHFPHGARVTLAGVSALAA